jgi:transposase-like protein
MDDEPIAHGVLGHRENMATALSFDPVGLSVAAGESAVRRRGLSQTPDSAGHERGRDLRAVLRLRPLRGGRDLRRREDLERKGCVRAKVVPDATGATLKGELKANAKPGSTLYTDSLPSYRGIEEHFTHATVNHLEEYVRGEVHTQAIENFWSLLKRSLKGTYVNVDPMHLGKYVDEQVLRFNERKGDDAKRHALVSANITGKRLTYEGLIGASECET